MRLDGETAPNKLTIVCVESSKMGFIVSAHRLTNITLLTLIATLQLQGELPTSVLNEDTQPVLRAIGVSPTACKER